MNTILFSIRPQYAQQILAGNKRVEYRRRLPARIAAGDRILIYETVPTGRVVGEALVGGIVSATPERIWTQTSDVGGVTRGAFDRYFVGRSVAHAIVLSDVQRYDPAPTLLARTGLQRAPQSYCYL